VCACGCFVLIAVIAVLAWTAIHGMWVLFALALIGAVAFGWFFRKYANWRPTPKP
jgi:hypothetical protein